MVSTGDIVQVEVYYTQASQRLMNAFGFRAKTGSGTFSQLAADFKTNVVKATSGGLFYGQSGQLSSTALTVRDVKPGTGIQYDLTYSAVTGSDGTSEALPPQCAAVISWRTSLAGRSYRGRTYLAGNVEAAQNNGVWGATQQTNMTNLAVNILAIWGPTGTDANWEFAVISRTQNGAPLVSPVATPIQTYLIRSTVYTQRRRTIGVGS